MAKDYHSFNIGDNPKILENPENKGDIKIKDDPNNGDDPKNQDDLRNEDEPTLRQQEAKAFIVFFQEQ